MNLKHKLELCEQMETLATKCRVANTDKARDYMACQACASYIKYICCTCPISVKQSLLKSNKIAELWLTVLDYHPGCEINRDALDNVERCVSNPMACHLSEWDMNSIYKLLRKLSEVAHNIK